MFCGVCIAGWLASSAAVLHHVTSRRTPVFEEPVESSGWPDAEALALQTQDGERLGAWYAPGKGDGAVVVMIHGNGGSRAMMRGRGRIWLELGASVLAPSVRAHGDSTGEWNDIGYSARFDVMAAVAEAEQRAAGRPVLVQGFSLGAAAAVFAAEPLGQRVSGYILEAPYRDLKHALRHRTELYLPPIADEVAYAGVLTVARLHWPQLDAISPEDAAARIPAGIPVLILAGSDDRRAPPSDARALHDRLPGKGQLFIVEGASHDSLVTTQPDQYRNLLRGMLASTRVKARNNNGIPRRSVSRTVRRIRPAHNSASNPW